MAPAMSTMVGIQVPAGCGPAHLEMLLFRYIETLELHHALRVLQRWPPASPMGHYAAEVLKELPSNYFQQPRLLPTGPRFVYINGQLTMRRIKEAMPMQQLHPSSTLGCVGPECSETVLDTPVLDTPLTQHRLRPLNSFMIFRSFCSPLFPKVPQKIKSMAIGQMWQDDPLKPQWAILAKSYTIIRDHFYVPNPTLRGFVTLCFPLIGLTTPEEYLDMCGWEAFISEDDNVSLQKTGESTLFQQFTPNPLAVDQVVNYCQHRGYAVPRNEEWPKHILPDGVVFAVEQSYQGIVKDPQNWIHSHVPQWPTEEFEVDEMYSDVDGDLPVICDPDTLVLDTANFTEDIAADASFELSQVLADNLEVEASTEQL